MQAQAALVSWARPHHELQAQFDSMYVVLSMATGNLEKILAL